MRKLFFLASIFIAMQLQAQVETVVQRSGGGACKDLAISPDGLLLARIPDGINAEIEIWNIKTGHLLRVIKPGSDRSGLNNMLSHVRFWKGSKNIITGTLQGNHEVYDVVTGKLVKKLGLTSYVGGVFAVNDKLGLFAALHPLSFMENQLIFYDLYANIVYDSLPLVIDRISALEFSPDGNQLAIGTKDGGFHIIDLKTQNRTKKVLEAHDKEIEYIQWTSDNYLLVSDENKFTLWDLKKNTLANIDSLGNKRRIVTSPTEDCFFMGGNASLERLHPNRSVQRQFGINPDIIRNIAFDNGKERMYVFTDNFVKLWDMNNITQKLSITNAAFFHNSESKSTLPGSQQFYFSPATRSAVYQLNDKVVMQGIDSGFQKSFNAGNKQPSSLMLAKDNYPVAVVGDKLVSWKGNTPKELPIPASYKLLFGFKNVKGDQYAMASDSVVHFVNAATGEQKDVKLSKEIAHGTISASGKLMAFGGAKLFVADASTLKLQELYDPSKEDFISEYGGAMLRTRVWASITGMCFSKDDKKLATINVFGNVKVWNLVSKKIDTVINANADFITFSPDNKLLIAAGNEMLWINSGNYKTEARISFLEKGDYIVTLPDNYYKASRNGAKAVAFRKGIQTSSFAQFDAVYNRPDLVTDKFGKPSAEMAAALKQAVAKRFKRSGLATTNTKLSTLEAPELVIDNYASIPTTTDDRLLKVSISAQDKKTTLQTFHGFVNGVPFNTRKGDDLVKAAGGQETKEISIDVTIALDPGRNLIELSCTNKDGIESARASFEIYYKGIAEEKPELYFIGIAAGEYKNPEYNLKYPGKDIEDVAALFRSRSDMFSAVNVTILKNEQVTRENILKLKEKLHLNNTKDYVVVYWSGHGVVNKDMDYYLATYDMDFNNPASKGMPYNELEDLMDTMTARKRLLMLDACHSGELDKDDASFTQVVSDDGKVTTYNTKGISLGKTKVVSTAGLFNELFSDIRRNSGANIISAAGAAEYALEGDSWANGVFTYSFIQGLKEKKADMNADGKITIIELQTYLQQRVPELTKGMQKPTSRTENLVNDWVIW